MRCSTCSFENPPEAQFCGSCGAPLAAGCAACGTVNPAGFRFCGSCGAPLAAEEVPAGAAPSAGERRRVTVLFADLVGFSTLAEHLDPEELRTLITGTFSELTEEVERRDGFVEKFIGDAIVAVFGAPVTHEDDPARAVDSALGMLEIVRRRSEGALAPLELRVGINSGLVVSGGVGDGTQLGVMGDAVNVAARLQQAAAPGEILLSAATWRRIRDAFDAEKMGELEVKGKAQTVQALRLLGRRERDIRYRAPFVGRHEELALLDLLWSSVRKGNTHVASLLGEPGAGKSRLLAEFRPEGAELDVRVACSGERAFGPFLELIGQLLGRLPADMDELKTKAAKFELVEEDVVLLGAFLGLGGAPPVVRMADEQRKRQVFAGVWQVLLAVCRGRPTFIALDDVHWADESSRELLDFLLERLSGLPLMLVLCYRPGFEQVERAELRASHTAVRLEPLSPEESVALARGLRSHLLNTLGWCQVVSGDVRGVERIGEALALAREVGDPEAIGRGYVNLSDTFFKIGRLRDALAIAKEGREVMRPLGAASFEYFIAGNQAQALVYLGRLDEAESLTRELITEHREVLGGAGFVSVGWIRVAALVRRVDYDAVRAQSDDVLAVARGLGGAEFLGNALHVEASLEEARGNRAAARQALREALELALADAVSFHVSAMLPGAARLLPADECRKLLDYGADIHSYPFADAHRTEAEAVLAQDSARAREAAELYRELEMPYEEARCRIGAGELERARELAEEFGFARGPLAPLLEGS